MKKRVSKKGVAKKSGSGKAVVKKANAKPKVSAKRTVSRAKASAGKKKKMPARTAKRAAPLRSTGKKRRSATEREVENERIGTELSAGPNQDPPVPGLDPTLPVNPVRGAPGHQVPETPSEDEDNEGRSMTEQMVEGGAKLAERDKVSRALSKRI